MRIRTLKTEQGIKFFSCGWRFCKKQLPVWVIASCVLVITAWLLTRIPVAGTLVFVFILPIVGASALIQIQDSLSQNKPATYTGELDPKQQIQKKFSDAGNTLYSVFSDLDRAIAVIALSTLAVVAVLLINILEQVTAGPARLDSVSIFNAGWVAALRFIGARLLSLVLYGGIITTLLYAIPLHFLNNEPIGDAVVHSIKAHLKNMTTMAIFLGITVSPFLVAAIVSSFVPYVGILLMVVFGILAFPIIACSIYCSYKLTFE